MGSLQHVWAWLGASDALAAAFIDELGEGASQLRDVAYIPHEEYAEAVKAFRIPNPTPAPATVVAEAGQTGTEDGGEPGNDGTAPNPPQTFRKPKATEIGKCYHFRRIARLRLGLPARDDVPELTL